MGTIRLYRQFYRIGVAVSGNTNVETYNVLTVNSLSATTYLSGTTSSPVESNLTPVEESTGLYYVDLNPIYYSYDNVYDLNWYVKYVSGGPTKRLITRWRLNPVNVANGGIEFEILNNSIEIEII